MDIQEIKDHYFSDIATVAGTGNLVQEKQGENFRITIKVKGDYEKILKILSKLQWTMTKLEKVANLKTDMKIEFIIKNSGDSSVGNQ